MKHGRFPTSVYGGGVEPDPRFSLANERTFLAWIRTALAFVAGGMAVSALPVPMAEPLRLAMILLLILAGVASAAQAWLGWHRTERALRLLSVLPSSGLKLPIAVLVGLVALAGAIGVLT